MIRSVVWVYELFKGFEWLVLGNAGNTSSNESSPSGFDKIMSFFPDSEKATGHIFIP